MTTQPWSELRQIEQTGLPAAGVWCDAPAAWRSSVEITLDDLDDVLPRGIRLCWLEVDAQKG